MTVISHDAKVVTINSADGTVTFPIAHLSADLQKRVQADNATAKDWTVNGRLYRNVIVGQVEADIVHITYDNGSGNVTLADLPPDLQRRFNYDPKAAAQASQQRAAAKAQAEAELQKQADEQKAAALAQAAKAQEDAITANTKTILEVETDQTAFKGKPFVIHGAVTLSSFIEYGDMYPEATYYCFKLDDQSTNDSAFAYGSKDSARAVKLRKELLATEGPLEGNFLVVIDPNRFYGNSTDLGLLFLDFYPPSASKPLASPTPAAGNAKAP